MNHPEFLDFAVAALRDAAVDTGQLCFEITETSIISNLAQAQRFMDAIRALGCRFALDDFGTGLSSFQYLRLLPAEFVKIDGSFIEGLASDDADHAMVEAVHHITGKMGKTTTAECVESAAVDAAVRDIGINYGQGYYYGRPVPIATALLSG